MTIKEIRQKSKMKQKEFAEYFGIPLRTFQNWEAGANTPSDYILRLIEYKLKNEGLI